MLPQTLLQARELSRPQASLGLGAALAVALTACGAGTAGESIQFDVAVLSEADGESVSSFTTRAGWNVELDRAEVILGPIHLHGGGLRASRWPPILDWLGPSKAYAHPADATFDGGPPLGDVIDQHVVDLLSQGTIPLARVYGLAGQVETFEVQIHPSGYSTVGSKAHRMASMGDHAFVLEGTASKNGEERQFVAAGNLGDEEPERTITSIETDIWLVDHTERAGPLVLHVDVAAWFRFVDFAAATELDERGRYRLPSGTVVGDSLRRGIRSRTAYHLEWSDHP
jgi:hypothetical protein